MKFNILIILSALFMGLQTTSAQTLSADEIVKRINSRDDGNSVSRTLTMELTDKRGKKRIRVTQAFRKYYGSERRTVIFYTSPKNVKDTAFLLFDYKELDRDDDQWLYLPAMRKVRRISASDRGDYFLGTDLSYEDIKLESKVSAIDYNYRIKGEDNIDGHHCILMEAIPVNKKTVKELGYSRTELCVDDEIWISRRTQVWGPRGKNLKTIHARNIEKIQGIWSIGKFDVENHKTGHHTSFEFSNIEYKKGVDDRIFTQDAIRRGL